MAAEKGLEWPWIESYIEEGCCGIYEDALYETAYGYGTLTVYIHGSKEEMAARTGRRAGGVCDLGARGGVWRPGIG